MSILVRVDKNAKMAKTNFKFLRTYFYVFTDRH